MAAEISGPDGPGGANVHDDWAGAGKAGDYVIALTGAAFVPTIPTLTEWGLVLMAALLIGGGVMVLNRRTQIRTCS